MTKNTTAEPGKKESAAAVIERIPNGIHLHRIREALDKGHAAVMVGSGFSLNAQGGNRLTVWDGLIDKLLADIYITADARKDAKSRLGGISGMLRLAEEYAAVRSRAHLDCRLSSYSKVVFRLLRRRQSCFQRAHRCTALARHRHRTSVALASRAPALTHLLEARPSEREVKSLPQASPPLSFPTGRGRGREKRPQRHRRRSDS